MIPPTKDTIVPKAIITVFIPHLLLLNLSLVYHPTCQARPVHTFRAEILLYMLKSSFSDSYPTVAYLKYVGLFTTHSEKSLSIATPIMLYPIKVGWPAFMLCAKYPP